MRNIMGLKTCVLAFICLSLFATLHGKSKAEVPVKRALVIAIGNYPASGGWSTLSSLNDIPYIQKMLNHQEFLDTNIAILKDSMAKRKNIENALNQLIAVSKPGDIVVIHISSHGEQIEDDNGDEPDGLDEAIVSWDAVAPKPNGNFKTDTLGYLRDDVFGAYVEKLRIKLGAKGDLVVFMDACHSGSGTRGVTKIRGGKPALVSPGFNKSKFQGKDTAGVFKEAKTKNADNLATYMVFSAARAEEFDYELTDENGQGMGSLTYAVSKAMEELEPGTSYRTLFSKIQSVLNVKVHNQHPVLEGNGQDRMLFSNGYVQQKTFFTINKINKDVVELNAGLFAGLDVGAVVGIYPIGTSAAEKGVAMDTGIVTSSQYYKSFIKLKKGKITNAALGWAFLLEPVYNLKPLIIKPFMANAKTGFKGYSDAELKTIRDSLKKQNLILFEGTPELLLKKGSLLDTLVMANSGYTFSLIDHKQLHKNLAAALQNYSQYRFLQEMKMADSNLRVELTLVPLANGKPDFTAVNSKNKNGNMSFKNGDKFVLSIKNPGNKNVYVNVLDLQPDGIINAVLPNKKQEIYPETLLILAGQTKTFSNVIITIGPPYGNEIFKVFVSKSAMDLEYLANTRGAGSKGNLNLLLEKVVKRSYQATRSGENLRKTSGTDGAVQQVMFEIVR